ncbi:hypothetical protein J6590_034081 [Homalodisca vitripennis]|nr:hypothetical protein J6590_034081 [Homalodisca vitripennis]
MAAYATIPTTRAIIKTSLIVIGGQRSGASQTPSSEGNRPAPVGGALPEMTSYYLRPEAPGVYRRYPSAVRFPGVGGSPGVGSKELRASPQLIKESPLITREAKTLTDVEVWSGWRLQGRSEEAIRRAKSRIRITFCMILSGGTTGQWRSRKGTNPAPAPAPESRILHSSPLLGGRSTQETHCCISTMVA